MKLIDILEHNNHYTVKGIKEGNESVKNLMIENVESIRPDIKVWVDNTLNYSILNLSNYVENHGDFKILPFLNIRPTTNNKTLGWSNLFSILTSIGKSSTCNRDIQLMNIYGEYETISTSFTLDNKYTIDMLKEDMKFTFDRLGIIEYTFKKKDEKRKNILKEISDTYNLYDSTNSYDDLIFLKNLVLLIRL